MPSYSNASLKKKNQELETQIDVLAEEIKNLKSQLGAKIDDESTAAAAQAEKNQLSPTNSVCPDSSTSRAQAVKRSSRPSKCEDPSDRRGREGN